MKNSSDEIPEDFREKTQEKYRGHLTRFFQNALDGNSFAFVCSILRVSGIHIGHWDPMEEALQAIDDYGQLLKFAIDQKNQKLLIRVGLLMYCHLVELTAVHEILFNLLKCKRGDEFSIKPFLPLSKPKKKAGPLATIPPSATTKFKKICELANEVGETELAGMIGEFFDDRIRNAFSHGDYLLTEEEFRWTEGGSVPCVMETLGESFQERFFTDTLMPLEVQVRAQVG